MTNAINQHYVPQFLLKNFQIKEKKGKESAIFIFDKVANKEYQGPIKSTGAERYFYEVKEQSYTIEDKLGEYESITGEIIRKILEHKGLKRLTRKEKIIISKFLALQILRVPAMRKSFSGFTEAMEEKFNYFESLGVPKPTQNEEKIAHCDFTLSSVNTFFPFIYNKDWLLCESVSEEYIIGDNPVVLNNTFNRERGNLGLASNGVEIYMPISPRYCLLLVCNSVRKTISEKLSNTSAVNPEAKFHAARLNKFVSNLKRSETVVSSQDNVIFANSLQVMFAERFIYSHNKKIFDLPKEMSNDCDFNKRVFQFF